MKKLCALPVACLLWLAAFCQLRDPAQLQLTPGLKSEILALTAQSGEAGCYFTDDYSNAGLWGWAEKKYITNSTGCALMPLPAGSPQGTISVTGGRVVFDRVAGAHENRIIRPVGTAIDRNFELKFDVQVTNLLQGSGTAFFPVVLTSNATYEPSYVTPITATCSFSPIDEIGVYCGSDVSRNNLQLGTVVLDGGTRSYYPGFAISYGIAVYVSLKVYGNGMATLFAYSDAARTVLIGQFNFPVPYSVNRLTYIQHSIASGGGYKRLTSALVDNTQICRLAKSCCRTQFNGDKVICEAGGRTAVNYTFSGDVLPAGVKVLPADIGISRTATGFTVYSWGSIVNAPKLVTVIDSFVCEGRVLYDTNFIYVHPRLDLSFNLNNWGTNGTVLKDFNAVSTIQLPGAVHQWEIFLSDAAGNLGTRVRDAVWTSGYSALSQFNVYALNSNPNTTHSQNGGGPYPDLTTGNFYLIKHVMYFDDGLCGAPEKRMVVYTFKNLKQAVNLGDPSAPEFKQKVKEVTEQDK